jgi:excinuclease ABC subunit A
MNNDKIKIINAKTHNLKGVTVEIPRNSLTVFTGLSGSGKSSLAFDTLYAEGQRRYVESLSAYARQFLDRLGKPDVERIEGLSPAISIEQHTSLGNPRSIVATVTEIHDYLRILYGSAATAHCPKCGRAVSRQSADQIVDALLEIGNSSRKKIILLAPVVKGKKGAQESVIQYAKRNGFARLYIDGEVYAVDDIPSLDKKKAHSIDLVIDRLQIPCDKTRLVDSVELALKEGGGVLRILNVDDKSISVFSELNACIDCGISFDELKSRSFSFNSPFGACPKFYS